MSLKMILSVQTKCQKTGALTSHPMAILHFGAIVPIAFVDSEKIRRRKRGIIQNEQDIKTSNKRFALSIRVLSSSIGKTASVASL